MDQGNHDPGLYVTWGRLFATVFGALVPMVSLTGAIWVSLENKMSALNDKVYEESRRLEERVVSELDRVIATHRQTPHVGAISRSEIDIIRANIEDRMKRIEGAADAKAAAAANATPPRVIAPPRITNGE